MSKDVEALCLKLEAIDKSTGLKGRESVEDLWRLSQEHQWLKGRELIAFYNINPMALPEGKKGRPVNGQPPWGGVAISWRQISKDIGVHKNVIQKWVKLAAQRPEEKRFYKWLEDAAKVVGQRWLSGLKGKPQIEAPAAPKTAGKYRVIYADPPWLYQSMQHTDTAQATTLDEHYTQMPTEDIASLPVASWIRKDAVLFLWVTSPKLYEAKEVIAGWGFDYKASIVWDKVKHNVGYYVSVRHELLLICTRGSCLPDVKKLEDSVVSIERTEHSAKPPYFREWIDRMYTPDGKDRLEMFPRGEIPTHWDTWGGES